MHPPPSSFPMEARDSARSGPMAGVPMGVTMGGTGALPPGAGVYDGMSAPQTSAPQSGFSRWG